MTAKKKILLVDDEEMLCRAMRLNLQETGNYEVMTESRGKEAVNTARQFKPDLIILDVIMPDFDGADIEKQLSQEEDLKHIPIIFLTAIATKEDTKDDGTMIGGRFVIAKPVSVSKLIESIEKRIHQKK